MAPETRAPDRASALDLWLVAVIAAGLILEAIGLSRLNVNWDEFHFLSRIHEYARGELPGRLQTFHVHFFGWLPRVGESEVDQVVAARSVLFVLGLGTRALLFTLARAFVGRTAALVVVALHVCFSYAIHHGASFRFDPMCAFLFLAALACLVVRPGRLGWAALAGAATALSTAITIKTAVALPTLAIALLFAGHAQGTRAALRAGAVYALTAAAAFAALQAFHAWSVPVLAAAADPTSFLTRVGKSVWVWEELFPRREYLRQSLEHDPLLWILLGAGILLTAAGLRHHEDRARRVVLLSLALPLASLVAYRNAFPYFYVFVAPAALVLCGVPVDTWLASQRTRKRLANGVVALVAGLVFLQGLRFHAEHRDDGTIVQREHLALVRELFPGPVPYLDRCSMVAGYPKVGLFMSRWVLEDYRREGVPRMREWIAEHQPVFVLANAPGLSFSERSRGTVPDHYRLLPEDEHTLRKNYVWHWGRLSVAGKQFELRSGEGTRRFEILVSGVYTLESLTPVQIDGATVVPGGRQWLAQGAHTISPAHGSSRVTLRYGAGLRRPQEAPAAGSLFTGFSYH